MIKSSQAKGDTMPFGNEFLQNATKAIDVKSIDTDVKFVEGIVKKAIKEMGKDASAVDVYLHGSYANGVNTYFPSSVEICVELKTKPFQSTLTDEYWVEHELEYSPKQFFAEFLEAMNKVVNPTVCETNNKCVIVPKHATLKHVVEITPCFSYTLTTENGAEFRGIILHDHKTGRDIASFPKLHKKNGETKDLKTGGNFKRMVRLFKTIRQINTRETAEEDLLVPARGYFIECLLFNVPDRLFVGGDLHDVFLKIINFLIHADIHDFACQNLVWHLFSTANEFWREKEASKFITVVKVFYHTFDPERSYLA